MQVLPIQIADSPKDAPNYKRMPAFKGATITNAIVVLKGTVEGRSTVDIQFEDEGGNKFVSMITGSLVKQLASIVEGAEQR